MHFGSEKEEKSLKNDAININKHIVFMHSVRYSLVACAIT